MTRKTKRIEIRVSLEEYLLITAKAEALGLTLSHYLRRTALRRHLPLAKTDQQVYQLLVELFQELNRIGVNLNQMTKACNVSLQLGEPVVVNRGLLEKNQNVLRQAVQELENILLCLTNC